MKKALTISRKILMIIIISSLLLSGCQSDKQKREKPWEIEVIYIENSYFGNRYIDKIDLVNKEHWIAGPITYSQDEEYSFVCNLDDGKIASFLHDVEKYKFLLWEEEYSPGIIHDGHVWSIEVCFSDNTEKVMRGHNQYPETWDEMSIAFEDLTGSIVFGTGRKKG